MEVVTQTVDTSLVMMDATVGAEPGVANHRSMNADST